MVPAAPPSRRTAIDRGRTVVVRARRSRAAPDRRVADPTTGTIAHARPSRARDIPRADTRRVRVSAEMVLPATSSAGTFRSIGASVAISAASSTRRPPLRARIRREARPRTRRRRDIALSQAVVVALRRLSEAARASAGNARERRSRLRLASRLRRA